MKYLGRIRWKTMEGQKIVFTAFYSIHILGTFN